MKILAIAILVIMAACNASLGRDLHSTPSSSVSAASSECSNCDTTAKSDAAATLGFEATTASGPEAATCQSCGITKSGCSEMSMQCPCLSCGHWPPMSALPGDAAGGGSLSLVTILNHSGLITSNSGTRGGRFVRHDLLDMPSPSAVLIDCTVLQI